MAQGGAVGSRRIPARNGFSALAIAGSSSLTLIAIGKGYHEAAPDNQSIGKGSGTKAHPEIRVSDERLSWTASQNPIAFWFDFEYKAGCMTDVRTEVIAQRRRVS